MYIKKQNDSGFTLIELLVSLALGLIVLSAVLGIFNSSSLSYNVQEDVAAVQQDVRVGKVFIERDIRMTGAGLEGYPTGAGLTAADLISFDFKNGAGVNSSDELTIRFIVPTPGDCGPDPVPGNGVDLACSGLPDLTLAATMPVNAVVSQIQDELGDAPFNRWDQGCYCNNTEYPSPQFGFQMLVETPPGEPYSGEMVTLTQVINNGQGTLDRLGNNEDPVLNEYPAGSTVRFFGAKPVEMARYYISDDGTLMREYDDDLSDTDGPRTDQIVEHIEDLQFAFGLDTNDDGQVDDWRGDDSSDTFVSVTVTDEDGNTTTYNDLSDTEKDQVRTVRISVLGRTDKARRELSPENRPALEDHAAATESDFFRRRLSQVEVELRNVALAIAN